jgi:hypothetical protein
MQHTVLVVLPQHSDDMEEELQRINLALHMHMPSFLRTLLPRQLKTKVSKQHDSLGGL